MKKTSDEIDKRNVERCEAANRCYNMLQQALSTQERSTIWNALSIAARAFEEDAEQLRKVAAALRRGETVGMFADGEDGARAADRLVAQFDSQLKDTRELLNKFE